MLNLVFDDKETWSLGSENQLLLPRPPGFFPSPIFLYPSFNMRDFWIDLAAPASAA